MPDANAAKEMPNAEPAKPGQDLLEFLGKVLDQLSISAWLPAAMLVGAGALLAQIHGLSKFDVGTGVSRLAHQPWGILVVLAFALVLTTMVIQAFEFEFIRLLEGYGGVNPVLALASNVGIIWHVKTRRRLEKRVVRLRIRAFAHARERMLGNPGVNPVLVDILELRVIGRARAADYARFTEVELDEAESLGWRHAALPTRLRRLEATSRKLAMYPEEHRVLPTMLGNTLRSTEDKLTLADGKDLEGFIMRNYDRITPALLADQAQFRTRLDMYCTLVLVFTVLAVASLAGLWTLPPGHRPALLTAVAFAVLARVSYAAAISSARGYGSTLRSIHTQVTAALAAEQNSVTSSTLEPFSARVSDTVRRFLRVRARGSRAPGT